jgi:hypothetical protein
VHNDTPRYSLPPLPEHDPDQKHQEQQEHNGFDDQNDHPSPQ